MVTFKCDQCPYVCRQTTQLKVIFKGTVKEFSYNYFCYFKLKYDIRKIFFLWKCIYQTTFMSGLKRMLVFKCCKKKSQDKYPFWP